MAKFFDIQPSNETQSNCIENEHGVSFGQKVCSNMGPNIMPRQ